MSREALAVLARYPVPRDNLVLTALGNADGFSGASLWRVCTGVEETYCLRQWPPEHPTPERLAWIHEVLQWWTQRAPGRTPVLMRNEDGETWVGQSGRLWELASWVPGKADFLANPSPNRLRHVMGALADLHNASEAFAREQQPSPAIRERVSGLSQLPRLLEDVGLRLESTRTIDPAAAAHATSHIDHPEVGELYETLRVVTVRVADSVSDALSRFQARPVPLFPVLRDVRAEHLFFEGDRLTGIVDAGAMRMDSPATDLSRCLRSLLGPHSPQWATALEHYAERREDLGFPPECLRPLDTASVMLSAAAWLRWLVIDGRRWESTRAVKRRLQLLRAALEPL